MDLTVFPAEPPLELRRLTVQMPTKATIEGAGSGGDTGSSGSIAFVSEFP